MSHSKSFTSTTDMSYQTQYGFTPIFPFSSNRSPGGDYFLNNVTKYIGINFQPTHGYFKCHIMCKHCLKSNGQGYSQVIRVEKGWQSFIGIVYGGSKYWFKTTLYN